jgi:hypothetical protein
MLVGTVGFGEGHAMQLKVSLVACYRFLRLAGMGWDGMCALKKFADADGDCEARVSGKRGGRKEGRKDGRKAGRKEEFVGQASGGCR